MVAVTSDAPTYRPTPPPRAASHPSSHSSRDQGRYTPGIVIAERYRLIALLGRGGMGEVYRADDLSLGSPVALKFLPEAKTDEYTLERFRNEVRIARRISHPNVCRVYDIGQAEDRVFLSMEYVDGEDLSSLLRRIGRLPSDKALEIARKICAGLAAAHDKGVLHRDLKPANIMLDGRGEALIMDFGLAGIAHEIEDVRSGTPAYMAPEQLVGQGSHGPQRHLLAGPGAVRVVHGQTRLRRQDAGRNCARAPRQHSASAFDAGARHGPAGRTRDPALPRGRSREPARRLR